MPSRSALSTRTTAIRLFASELWGARAARRIRNLAGGRAVGDRGLPDWLIYVNELHCSVGYPSWGRAQTGAES
jgi:hypothetical protein